MYFNEMFKTGVSHLMSVDCQTGIEYNIWGISKLTNVIIDKFNNRYPSFHNQAGDMGQHELIYDINQLKNQYERPRVLKPREYSEMEEFFQGVINWWIRRERKSPLSIKRYIALARRMANHPIFPVNWLEPDKERMADQLVAYFDYVEEYEGATPHRLRN